MIILMNSRGEIFLQGRVWNSLLQGMTRIHGSLFQCPARERTATPLHRCIQTHRNPRQEQAPHRATLQKPTRWHYSCRKPPFAQISFQERDLHWMPSSEARNRAARYFTYIRGEFHKLRKGKAKWQRLFCRNIIYNG